MKEIVIIIVNVLKDWYVFRGLDLSPCQIVKELVDRLGLISVFIPLPR